MKKIIYFSAPWCGPCKVLGPTMQKLSSELPITKVNVDEDNTTSAKYGIRNIPTLILIDETGKEINRLVGNVSEQQIKQFYNG
jgi:thioredoxin 1|tara:strand:- start:142 stop:390 length:249 start_codon:yes stop_codon:yes gene_type:complete